MIPIGRTRGVRRWIRTARDGRRTNLAGIDLTPAAARQLGIEDKGEVEWSS